MHGHMHMQKVKAAKSNESLEILLVGSSGCWAAFSQLL